MWRYPETKILHLSLSLPVFIWLVWFNPYEHWADVQMGCNERKPSPSLAAWGACQGSPRQELLRRPCIPQWSSHKWQWWFQNLFLYKFLLLSPLPSAIWINPLCKSKYCLKLSSITNNIFLKTLPLLLSLTTNALIGGKSVYSSLLPPSRSYQVMGCWGQSFLCSYSSSDRQSEGRHRIKHQLLSQESGKEKINPAVLT